MRTYIITPHEKKILEEYLKTGVKLNGFSRLLNRLKDYHENLSEEIALIMEVCKREGIVK